MKRLLLSMLLALPLWVSSCDSDEGYEYPSVKLEFLTAETGSDGCIESVVTDDGRRLPIEKDHTRSQLQANASVRIVSNYELLTSIDNKPEVRIYGLMQVVAVDPKPRAEFENGVKRDPVDVTSVWLGQDYINMVLGIHWQNAKHRFGFIEESVTDHGDGRPDVKLSLYHDNGGDMEAYSERAYLSIPLKNRYPEGAHITLYFHTYDDNNKNKAVYEFEYIPKAIN